MERHGEEVELTETEASAGSRPRVMRYVLAISLTLAIIILSLVWMNGAWVFSDENPGAGAGSTNS